jgi:hypothetical protein
MKRMADWYSGGVRKGNRKLEEGMTKTYSAEDGIGVTSGG